jgi:xanthine dehydrogenase iron-sulfur cluster and FAD-binding subunit A
MLQRWAAHLPPVSAAAAQPALTTATQVKEAHQIHEVSQYMVDFGGSLHGSNAT